MRLRIEQRLQARHSTPIPPVEHVRKSRTSRQITAIFRARQNVTAHCIRAAFNRTQVLRNPVSIHHCVGVGGQQ